MKCSFTTLSVEHVKEIMYIYKPIGLKYMGKAEDTKQLIIKKSAELFNKFGYDGCSLSDIMKATNLKKGGIYNHFQSKDEIAISAYEYSANKVFRRFQNKLKGQKSNYDKLLTTIEVYASFARDPVITGGCPIFNTAIDAHNSHPQLKKKAQEGIMMMKQYIEIKLKEGEAEKEFICKTDKSDIATMIFVTLEGAIVYSRVNKDFSCIDLAVSHLKNYLTQNIQRIIR